MAGNLKKFVNPRFIKTIDLGYMRRLLARHEGQYTGFTLDVFDQDETETREAIADLLAGSETKYPEGLRSDLHRIAELGNAKGLDIIQAQADRQGINLFTAPIFLLVPQVKLRKRLDLARDAEKVAASVPGLIIEKWVDQA